MRVWAAVGVAALCVAAALALSDVREMSSGDLGDSEGSEAERRDAFHSQFVTTLKTHGVKPEKAERMYTDREHLRELGEGQGLRVQPVDEDPHTDTIYALKHKANMQAKNLLEMEGELSKLVATNTMHASSAPPDFDVKDEMLKAQKMKGGVMTGSTSEKYMVEQNEKFLMKEEGRMKELLEQEYTSKKQAMKKKMMEEQMAANVKKMEAKLEEENLKRSTMEKDSRKNRSQRLKELYDTKAKEEDLVLRYEHLKSHRAKNGLTVEGPVKMLDAAEPGKPSAIAGATPQQRAAAAEAPDAPEPAKPPTVMGSRSGEEEEPAEKEKKTDTDVSLSKMGPTHRRRNPPAY